MAEAGFTRGRRRGLGFGPWLRLLLVPLCLLVAVALVHRQLWPGPLAWSLEAAARLSPSDVVAWARAIAAYPAHQLWLDATPTLAAALGMDLHSPDGATFYFGLLDWFLFALIVGSNGPQRDEDEDF